MKHHSPSKILGLCAVAFLFCLTALMAAGVESLAAQPASAQSGASTRPAGQVPR